MLETERQHAKDVKHILSPDLEVQRRLKDGIALIGSDLAFHHIRNDKPTGQCFHQAFVHDCSEARLKN